MRALFLLLLLMPAGPAYAINETVPPPIVLTDGATITVPCPGPLVPVTYYLTLTGNNHQILFPPACPVAANGLSVKFKINVGNNSGSPYTGLSLASGFNWTGGTPYANCTGAGVPNPACPAAEVANQVDWFGCDVVGTTSASVEWDCWGPQYNVRSPFTIVAQSSCTGTGSAGCTTSAINTTGANLFIVSITSGAASPAITDSTSANSYTQVISEGGTGTTGFATIDYVANPTTSATQTFTTSNTTAALGILAVNIASPAVDQNSGANNGGTPATTQQPGSITPTQSGVIVAVCAFGGTSAVTINDSFVATNLNYAGSAGNYYASLAAYLYPGGIAAINPTCTSSSSTAAAAQVSFK